MTGTAGFSVYPVGQQAAAQWVQTKYEIEFKSSRLANFTVTLLNMLNRHERRRRQLGSVSIRRAFHMTLSYRIKNMINDINDINDIVNISPM